jgi:hypothetical protein
LSSAPSNELRWLSTILSGDSSVPDIIRLWRDLTGDTLSWLDRASSLLTRDSGLLLLDVSVLGVLVMPSSKASSYFSLPEVDEVEFSIASEAVESGDDIL